MTDRELEVGTGPLNDADEELLEAIDLASCQDQRSWVTREGKRIARIVTAEDGELLDKLDLLAGRREVHTIRNAQIVSWGPVSDAPWRPGHRKDAT